MFSVIQVVEILNKSYNLINWTYVYLGDSFTSYPGRILKPTEDLVTVVGY